MNVRRHALLAAVAAVCVAWGVAPAGERGGESTTRSDVADLVRQMNDVYSEIRVEAIREAGELEEKELVEQFGLLDRLLAKVRDEGAFDVERTTALESLVNLYTKGIGRHDMLQILAEVVESGKSPMLVRMEALRLIARMAGGEDVVTEKAYLGLRGILERKRDLPSLLVARIYEALGGFYRMRNVLDALLEGVDSKHPEIRAGALRGLVLYLERSGDTDEDAQRALTRFLQKAETEAERRETIHALEILAANGASFPSNSVVKKALLDLLKDGSDELVQSAIRLLIRMADKEVTEAFLAYALPGKRDLSFETIHKFNMALVEVLNQLRQQRDLREAQTMADKIVKHFMVLLDPKHAGVPEPVRLSAVFGLGVMPRAFDRTIPFKILVRTLALTESETVRERTERALRTLMGREPFRKPAPAAADGGEGDGDGEAKIVPDIEAYKAWFAEHEASLKPGKAPWDR